MTESPVYKAVPASPYPSRIGKHFVLIMFGTSITVNLARGPVGSSTGPTCYYPKRAALADAISANPAGPDGITLRTHIADAIVAAGGERPTGFVRF